MAGRLIRYGGTVNNKLTKKFSDDDSYGQAAENVRMLSKLYCFQQIWSMVLGLLKHVHLSDANQNFAP